MDDIPYAERQYINETTVYAALKSLHGRFIPRYFGSYICSFSIGATVHVVPRILIEYIRGHSLLPFDKLGDAKYIDEDYPGRVSYFANQIMYRDLAPRDIFAVCKTPA